MINAMRENAKMLAAAAGIEEDDAGERLDRTVLITSAADASTARWTAEITALLERTLGVTVDPECPAHLELVIGDVAARTGLKRVYAGIDASKAVINLQPVRSTTAEPHPLFAAVAASSVVAATVFMAVDVEGLPKVRLPLMVSFDQLGVSKEALSRKIDLDGAVQVGAGAVGNAFLRALRHVDARGTLPIVDPKNVGGGNPNRCLYFANGDVGQPKAEALTRNAQAEVPRVTLVPHKEEFHSYVARNGPQATAIVTVDSRRVRRSIQAEVPGRVFDASTTDIRAVVIHSHQQPTVNACLSCIYRHVPDENARERAIAEGLGIELEMVKENLISAAAAARIAATLVGVSASVIEGMAYDSLFKQLCAEKALRSPEGKQVLAPFAFVSALAGSLLVIEMLRAATEPATTNYWQVDPWGAPIDRVRSLRPRIADCEFCSKPHAVAITEQLWGSRAGAV